MLAAPLPACRRYVIPPNDSPEAGAVTGGKGGTGGTGGTGGSGATGGGAGTDTNPTPADGDPLDARTPDRPDVLVPDGPEPCGGVGAKCCPGNRCSNNGCCANGACVAGFELCPEESASCLGTTCGGICGGLKEKCCGAAGYCVRELTVCVRSDAGGAKCESCGNTGSPCCNDNYCEIGRCMAGKCMP